MVSYLLLTFLWPHVVFGQHLREKSPVYRFSFCVTVQTVLANTVVLGLGLLHILNHWVVCIAFYSPLVVILGKRGLEILKKNEAILRSSPSNLFTAIVRRSFFYEKKRMIQQFAIIRPHFLEYVLLGIISIYSLIYFSWGAFQTTSYGFGDLYVHHSWTYGLTQGTIFANGVYPEAMHCVLYVIHALLGIPLFSVFLFFGSIQSTLFLISAYCFLRELLQWRYTPIFILAAIVLLEVDSGGELNGIVRLQWALPREFSLTLQMLCVLFFLRYLRSKERATKKSSPFIWNRQLFIFMMALAGIIASHFYSLIMAFFMCVVILLLHLREVFSKERFVPLVAAVLSGLLIAGTPMVAAFLSGIPLENSLIWGINIINGTNVYDESRLAEAEDEDENAGTDTYEQTASLPEKIRDKASFIMNGLYHGYSDLTGLPQAAFYIRLTLLIALLYPLLRLSLRHLPIPLEKLKKFLQVMQPWFFGYLHLALLSVIIIILYAAPYLKLPEIIVGDRLSSTAEIFLYAILIIPVDTLFAFFAISSNELILHTISFVSFMVFCIWGISGRNYHGYLYQELSRYKSEVAVTIDIIEKYPKFQYTIVAPTDALYHVIEHGRHEELLNFVTQTAEDRYYIPTKYVFIYIEKHPLQYAQRYFLEGPSWLASEKYLPLLQLPNSVQSPNILSSNISMKAASKELDTSSVYTPFLLYNGLGTRTIIESKAYYWCQRFAELYPHEMSVYYEDDDFVCYYFEQEPHSPYNLAIDYERLYEEE